MLGGVYSPVEWFVIIFILFIYLKEKRYGAEIKTSITGDVFDLVTIIFVGYGYFLNLGKVKDSLWYELHLHHQMKVYYWSVGPSVYWGGLYL